MDKPVTLSVKNFLIRRMAVEIIVSEKIIEAVVNHQFNSMLEATTKHYSVELSGFGKFIFNNNKALRMMQKYTAQREVNLKLLTETLTEQKKRNVLMRLAYLEEAIECLKPRLRDKV